ncbi:MAG: PIN domain-containing protein [Acidimicrobiia bacterium]|nr:PIN domain-containing protein [Acidimicrobiia bacterium]
MIADTSALIAILRNEDDAHIYAEVIAGHDRVSLSAASYLECGVVIDSDRDPVLSRTVDELISESEIAIVSVTEAQARIARQAYHDFGKGSGHPARLTFADCFSYALAVDVGEPLLWKGDDFGHTGLRSGLAG